MRVDMPFRQRIQTKPNHPMQFIGFLGGGGGSYPFVGETVGVL